MLEQVIMPLLPYIGKPLTSLLPTDRSISFHKGLGGRLIEQKLGATSPNSPLPDLPQWGIEIKTIPVTPQGTPLEHTFVNKISLPFTQNHFESSPLWAKLKKILWVPLVGSKTTPLLEKIIAPPILWEPSCKTRAILQQDWDELTTLVRLHQFDQIDSQLGEFLHIRPKASHGSEKITLEFDGMKKSILPIGFYLRKKLTQQIIKDHYAI